MTGRKKRRKRRKFAYQWCVCFRVEKQHRIVQCGVCQIFCNRIWSTATTRSTSSAVAETESGVVGTCNKDPCVYAGFLSEESLSLHHCITTTTNKIKLKYINTHPREGAHRAETSVVVIASRGLTVRKRNEQPTTLDQTEQRDNILRIKRRSLANQLSSSSSIGRRFVVSVGVFASKHYILLF